MQADVQDAPSNGAGVPPGGHRVALVTGASGGVGSAVVGRLAEFGWRVAGLDLHASTAELSLVGDVADPAAVTEAVAEATRSLGPLDLLVTAAGLPADPASPEQVRPDSFARVLAVHLGGTVIACRAVLPGMLERGSGCIVALIAGEDLSGSAPGADHAASAGAVLGLVRSLATETAAGGVRVNSVSTSVAATAGRRPQHDRDGRSGPAPGHPGYYAEVADSVLFLATEGTFFTGQALTPHAAGVMAS